MTLPKEFEAKMKELLKEEFLEYEDSFNKEHFSGIRYNSLKISNKKMEEISPVKLEKIPYIPNGYFYNQEEQPARHPYYHAGLYYLQEPSAMTPASLLPVKKGDKVLDICAAPGGKSTELASKLQGEGVLVTNDISNSRAKALLKNIELFGVKNAIVMSESPDKMEDYFPEYFDKILVDAPCSGEGMFRKVPSMVKNWEDVGVSYYTQLQREIIISAAKMLKVGGYLLFSTCTFSPEENEGTIEYLLETYPNFHVVSPYDFVEDTTLSFEGFASGRPEWIHGMESIKDSIRLWPHKIQGEGHFICLLQKGQVEPSDDKVNTMVSKSEKNSEIIPIHKLGIWPELEALLIGEHKEEKKSKKDKFSYNESNRKDFTYQVGKKSKNGTKGYSNSKHTIGTELESNEMKEFFDDLFIHFEEDRFLLLEDKLYYLPEGLPSLKGLRLLRNGLLLGEVKKNRFEPSHPLALALKNGEYRKVINLSVEDDRVIKYLKGETIEIEVPMESGYYLIQVDGYSLGWGKLSKTTVKNKYNPGWRWM